MKFQACVGPTMNRVHIKRTDVPVTLSLCARVAPARDYKGALAIGNICKRCLTTMFELQWGPGVTDIHPILKPTDIGVRDLEP